MNEKDERRFHKLATQFYWVFSMKDPKLRDEIEFCFLEMNLYLKLKMMQHIVTQLWEYSKNSFLTETINYMYEMQQIINKYK